LLQGRRSLPPRPLRRRHLPQLRLREGPRRPVRELHKAARPHRPHQPPLRHLRLDGPGDQGNQAPPSPAVGDEGEAPRLDRLQDRLARPHHLHRQEVAPRRRRPPGPRHHPRPRLGRPRPEGRPALARHGGQGLLRLVRRPHRIHRLRQGMDRRGRPPGRRLGTLVAHRPWCGGRPLHPVHGQGQRPLPHPLLPRDHHGLGRGLEARRLHQVLQLPELRRRPVLHVPGPRRLHGPGPLHPARRLLALVAPLPRPRILRLRIHLGELPGLREQGPRRRLGQLRFPHHQVLPLQVRRAGPRRRHHGRPRNPAPHRPRHAPPSLRICHGCHRGPQIRRGAPLHLGPRQRIPAIRRPLDHPQDRPRPGRDADPPGPQPHPPLRRPVAPVHPRRGAADDGRARLHRLVLAHRHAAGPGHPPPRPRLHRARGDVPEDHRRAARRLADALLRHPHL
ncbi:MAG: Methionyl-tRNA synthetase, partial [uncultured Rubellimicrobium sp.]